MVILMLPILVILSCGKSPEQNLIGDWGRDGVVLWRFDENGTGKAFNPQRGETYPIDYAPIDYEVDSSVEPATIDFTLTDSRERKLYGIIQFKDDTLYFNYDDDRRPSTFHNQEFLIRIP